MHLRTVCQGRRVGSIYSQVPAPRWLRVALATVNILHPQAVSVHVQSKFPRKTHQGRRQRHTRWTRGKAPSDCVWEMMVKAGVGTDGRERILKWCPGVSSIIAMTSSCIIQWSTVILSLFLLSWKVWHSLTLKHFFTWFPSTALFWCSTHLPDLSSHPPCLVLPLLNLYMFKCCRSLSWELLIFIKTHFPGLWDQILSINCRISILYLRPTFPQTSDSTICLCNTSNLTDLQQNYWVRFHHHHTHTHLLFSLVSSSCKLYHSS